jgi:hypothetical protein
VSPEREQRAFESPLAQELTRPNGLLQTVVHGPEQAVEVMRLAARQYRRALRTTPSAVPDDDPDQVYVLVYEAIRAAAAALLLANGYRARGGERSHVEALRLAALGLAAWHPDEARLLERIRPSITRARNEMLYARPQVVTVRELRQFLRGGIPTAPRPAWLRRTRRAPARALAGRDLGGPRPARRGLSSPGSPRTVRFLSASAG